MNNIIYNGFFIDHDSIKKLEKIVGHVIEVKRPHVTYRFRPSPDEYHLDLRGEKVTLIVVGYGKSDNNEGLLVDFPPTNSLEALKLLRKIRTPHITTWVSENGKAVDTAFLDFKPILNVEITATFSWFEGR